MNLRETITKTNNNATNRIAYVVLAVFCLFLLIILINALFMFSTGNWDNPEKMEYAQTWLSLFKDGFLLLGGALTTLIGYYFGTKGSEAALENAEKYTKEAEKLVSELDEAAPTYDENDSQIQSF